MSHSRRRRAREVVLQVLYGDDVNPQRNQRDVAAFLRERLLNDVELVEFAEELLSGVRRNRPELDGNLLKWAEHWSLERMAATDRNVLRLGAFEILHAETPGPVAIDEAVELARRYGTRQSAHFVNGVLDRILKDYTQQLLAASAAEATSTEAPSTDVPSTPDTPSPPSTDAGT